jgi:hypothetical protein
VQIASEQPHGGHIPSDPHASEPVRAGRMPPAGSVPTGRRPDPGAGSGP